MILTTLPATNVRTARRGDGGLHPGTASQLTIQAGSNQTAVAGTAVPVAPAVLVLDQLNRPISQVPIQFVVAGGSTASEVTMDPFNRADQNPLAGNWTKAGGAATNLQLLSNAVQGVTAGGEGLLFYNAVTWPADQYAECQVSVASTAGGGPAVRVSAGAETGYIAQVHLNGTAISMAKYVAGTYTGFQDLSVAVSSTDTIRLEVRGSTLRLYKNGVQVGADVIDGSITTGAAGMDYFSTTTGTIDNWAAGLPPTTSGTVTPNTPLATNAAGVAAATVWTLGTIPGVNTLTVTSAGLVGSPLLFTATGVSSGVQATQIAINTGNGQSSAAGAAVAIAPSVIVRDASNNPVAGVLVTFAIASGGGSLTGASQTTNASGIATVGSWTLGAIAGANTLTASSAGLTGSPVTFTATGTGTGIPVPDPTLLPVAASQAPNLAVYGALNMVSRAAGFSYADPVTGVTIWKVTSPTVPTANANAGHDYGDGGCQVSRGWGTNANTHTILIGAPQATGNYYLVDFTRGTGFSNYRVLTVQPRRDICASFSNVVGSERILYIHTGTQLVRYNTQTMAVVNTGFFPLVNNAFGWLHQDLTDTWFTGLVDDQLTVWAWNSQTNQFLTHNETWTNEPRLERNGRYLVITGGGPGPQKAWDLSTNTFGAQQTLNYFSHLASLRGRWIGTDPNATAPQPLDRYQVVAGSVTRTVAVYPNSGGSDTNNSGNWIQGDDNLQWAYISGTDDGRPWQNLLIFNRAIGLVRADGSDARMLCHHYTHTPTYWDLAWGQPSPDGKVVIFNSNMQGSGRYDLFVAEVPFSLDLNFYVSPTGAASNIGSIASPWDWATVLNSATPPAAIVPGSTIWVRGGTYTIDRTGISGDMTITTTLHGTAANPIRVRAYPGERPVFSGIRNPIGNNLMTWILGGGEYTWFWGLEWQSPAAAWTNGRTSTSPSSDNPSDVNGAGFVVRINSGNAADQDVGIKVIHCIVHDTTSNGSSSQEPGGLGSEAYGNVVFNNGWVGSDRAHQHGTYNQNTGTNPRKYWEANVVIAPFANGAQFFGTATPAQNIEADDNIITGANSWSTQFASGLLFEVSSSLDNLAFLRNLTWISRTRNLSQWGNRLCSFGSQLTTNEGSINISDNVLFSATGMSGFATLTFRGNRCVGGRTGTPGNEVWIIEYYRNPTAVEDVDLNEYYNAGNDTTPFHRLAQGGGGLVQYTLAQWRTNLGFDAAGSYSAAVPTTNWVYVKPTTRYEANRGHVVIYNWEALSSQAVDLSTILTVGQNYEVWDLWTNPRYVGTPLLTGSYAGGTVAFPLATRTAPVPTGWGAGAGETATLTNENEFHVFLVRGL